MKIAYKSNEYHSILNKIVDDDKKEKKDEKKEMFYFLLFRMMSADPIAAIARTASKPGVFG